MPFVTITLLEGKDKKFIKSLSEIIHTAMIETISIAPEVLYHVVHELKSEQLIYMPEFRGLKRSADFIMLQIIIRNGRSAELKKEMFKKISDGLNTQLGIRKEDLLITLLENSGDNWYFGEKDVA